MPKKLLVISAALAFLAPPLPAGEEYLPMHPGARSEIGPGVVAGPLQRASSAESPGRPERPLHKNMVRLTLPSLGPRPEAKPRLVQVGVDGSLDFSAAALPTDETGIPGLVPPELLAVDQYNFADPEPARRPWASSPAPDEPEPYPAGPAPAAGPEPGFAALAEDLVGPKRSALRRLDSLERDNPGVAFARIELPPAAAAAADSQSMLVSLPPPLPSETSPAYFDPRSARAPAQTARRPLRPPPVEEVPAPFVPEQRGEPADWQPFEPAETVEPVASAEPLRPPAEPFFPPESQPGPPRPELFAAPEVSAPAARPGLTPVRELKNVLGPIYRNAGR